jgi:hypothetical protein
MDHALAVIILLFVTVAVSYWTTSWVDRRETAAYGRKRK